MQLYLDFPLSSNKVPPMQVSAYSDYSLRLLMYAALRSPHRVTIVHDLGRSGYLKTYRGIGGGFILALPAGKIGVGDVVRLGEESDTVIECKKRREGPCRIRSVCRLRGMLDEAA
ncbi:MAG: Rrf2 family transcriptional regulator, partial [Chthoniobacterales bacterium]